MRACIQCVIYWCVGVLIMFIYLCVTSVWGIEFFGIFVYMACLPLIIKLYLYHSCCGNSYELKMLFPRVIPLQSLAEKIFYTSKRVKIADRRIFC